MIAFPDHKELETLEKFDKPNCITMYVPYIQKSGAANPNHIELKNILRDAQKLLKENDVDAKTIKKTLDPAYKLLESDELLRGSHDSIVIFAHPEYFRYFHIPDPHVTYLLTLETGFRLGPLRRIIKDDQPFYLLTLSHHGVQFYSGNRFNLKEHHIPNLPKDLESALRIDEEPQMLETHTVAPADRGHKSKTYHGQYNKVQVDKQWLHKYFSKVDATLHSFLKNKDDPLIIAGVDYLLPIYQKANTYLHILADNLTGNFEKTPPEELHKLAWQLIEK